MSKLNVPLDTIVASSILRKVNKIDAKIIGIYCTQHFKCDACYSHLHVQCAHGGYQVERGGHGQMSFGHSQHSSQHKIIVIGGLGLPMQTTECNHGKDLANEVVGASSTILLQVL